MDARSLAGALLLALGFALAACDQDGPASPVESILPPGPAQAGLVAVVPEVCGEPMVAPLVAAQDLGIGTVAIANDDDVLYVSFRTEDGWAMTDTHVAAATDADQLPKQGKRLVPGRFPYKDAHEPAATVLHYAIPLPVPSAGGDVTLAAHADVVKEDRHEGAWAEGQARDGGGWATYVTYQPASCQESDDPNVIGPGGGEIEAGDVVLVIPAGALPSDVEISVEPVDESELPDGVLIAYDFGPDGLEFDEPVELTIQYDDTGLSLEQEQDVAIHLLQSDGTLLALPTVVDTDANTVTALITHFSIYTVALPEARLELRVGSIGVPWYSNGSVWEGFQLRHSVLVFNLTTSPISGSDVTVEFTAEGPVAPFGVSYSTGLCSLATPTATTYHFTCTMPSFDIAPGTAATLGFHFTTATGSGGETFDVSASFAYGAWAATTGTVSTDIVAPPDEADLELSMDPLPPEIVVGDPLVHTVHVVNRGPGPTDGATFDLEVLGDVAVDQVSLPDGCTWEAITDGVRVACTVGSLVPGFGTNRSITVIPQSTGAEGELFSTATLIDVQGATDPNPDNDTADAGTMVIEPSQ